MQFALGIYHAVFQTFRQCIPLFVNTPQYALGTFVIVVELLITRFTLTQTHLLDIGHEQFHLIIGHETNAVKEFVGILIVHLHNAYKRKVVECLCPSGMIIAS